MGDQNRDAMLCTSQMRNNLFWAYGKFALLAYDDGKLPYPGKKLVGSGSGRHVADVYIYCGTNDEFSCSLEP